MGENEKARILVTGAGGFLGSHICDYFGSRGYKIGAVGRFSRALNWTKAYPNLEMFWGLTLPDDQFAYVLQAFRPTMVVHCAGTASVAESVAEPYGDFKRTVEVCAFTLESMRRHAPQARFALLSSAAVYGNPESLPIKEDAKLSSISPYAYHKRICETLAEEYASLHGIPCSILRIFSAYGERLRRQVVHDLVKKFMEAGSSGLEVYGTGQESRDFVHAVDVAQAVECIFQKKADGIFNVASGQGTTIEQLCKLISESLRTRKKVQFTGASRKGDPMNWQADISKLNELGFSPRLSLAEGLKQYISWYQSTPFNTLIP